MTTPISRKANSAKRAPTKPNGRIRYLGDVQRLVLKRDDMLVLSTEMPITREQADMLREQLKLAFGGRRKMIVLSDGMKIGVLDLKK